MGRVFDIIKILLLIAVIALIFRVVTSTVFFGRFTFEFFILALLSIVAVTGYYFYIGRKAIEKVTLKNDFEYILEEAKLGILDAVYSGDKNLMITEPNYDISLTFPNFHVVRTTNQNSEKEVIFYDIGNKVSRGTIKHEIFSGEPKKAVENIVKVVELLEMGKRREVTVTPAEIIHTIEKEKEIAKPKEEEEKK